jgi:hypothetical protein
MPSHIAPASPASSIISTVLTPMFDISTSPQVVGALAR